MSLKFANIKPSFWNKPCLLKCDPISKLVAIYLMTNERFNQTGLYHIQICAMSHDLSLTEEEVLQALGELEKVDFCSYDDERGYLWVKDMILTQTGRNTSLRQRIGVNNNLWRLHHEEQAPFVDKLLERHGYIFDLPKNPEELKTRKLKDELPTKPTPIDKMSDAWASNLK